MTDIFYKSKLVSTPESLVYYFTTNEPNRTKAFLHIMDRVHELIKKAIVDTNYLDYECSFQLKYYTEKVMYIVELH